MTQAQPAQPEHQVHAQLQRPLHELKLAAKQQHLIQRQQLQALQASGHSSAQPNQLPGPTKRLAPLTQLTEHADTTRVLGSSTVVLNAVDQLRGVFSASSNGGVNPQKAEHGIDMHKAGQVSMRESQLSSLPYTKGLCEAQGSLDPSALHTCSLPESVLEQIRLHHKALRGIFTQQLQQQLQELGVDALEAELLTLDGRLQIEQAQYEGFRKICGILQQDASVQEADQQYLAQTMERVKAAQAKVAATSEQKQEKQAQLTQLELDLKVFSDMLRKNIKDIGI